MDNHLMFDLDQSLVRRYFQTMSDGFVIGKYNEDWVVIVTPVDEVVVPSTSFIEILNKYPEARREVVNGKYNFLQLTVLFEMMKAESAEVCFKLLKA